MREGTPTLSAGLRPALDDLQGAAGGFRRELTDATRAMEAMDGQAKRLSRSLGSSLRSAFDKAVFGGGKLSEVFRDLGRDILGRTVDAALRPVQSAISGGISSAVSGLTGTLVGALGFAKGGAFSAGRVQPFARGGVLDGPVAFPMRGATGLMGEAGPEAIMPLRRGADGRLGVEAAGGSAPTIVVNIQTPDIAGFERSRGQIAAQMARIVARGQARL